MTSRKHQFSAVGHQLLTQEANFTGRLEGLIHPITKTVCLTWSGQVSLHQTLLTVNWFQRDHISVVISNVN